MNLIEFNKYLTSVDIVIVNWNAGSLIKDCIDSIFKHCSAHVGKVIVVDNGSTDGSIDFLVGLPSVTIYRAGENLGFGKACNIGAKLGESPYVLFLNPDTRLGPDSISVPLTFMEQPQNQRVGICGIQLLDNSGIISRSCARYPTVMRFFSAAIGLNKFPLFSKTGIAMTDWDHNETSKVDQVIGAFFFCRRKTFELNAGFDERFFVYYEEVDFSLRSSFAGWESWYLHTAQAFHAGGGASRQVKAHRLFYLLRSRLLFSQKHFPKHKFWLVIFITVTIELFSRLMWCFLRGDLAGIKNTLLAYKMLFCWFGELFNKA